MDRVQSKSAHRSARLGRRREAFAAPLETNDAAVAPPLHMRRRAVWALVSVGVVVATVAVWSVQPGGQSGEALAVSVPAASSPAAATVPATVRS